MSRKGLSLYLICGAVIVTALFVSIPVMQLLSPPITAEAAVAVARKQMEGRLMTSRNDEHIECGVDDYPEGLFGDNQAFDVTCSIFRNSDLRARTTLVFGRDGLGGHEHWDLSEI